MQKKILFVLSASIILFGYPAKANDTERNYDCIFTNNEYVCTENTNEKQEEYYYEDIESSENNNQRNQFDQNSSIDSNSIISISQPRESNIRKKRYEKDEEDIEEINNKSKTNKKKKKGKEKNNWNLADLEPAKSTAIPMEEMAHRSRNLLNKGRKKDLRRYEIDLRGMGTMLATTAMTGLNLGGDGSISNISLNGVGNYSGLIFGGGGSIGLRLGSERSYFFAEARFTQLIGSQFNDPNNPTSGMDISAKLGVEYAVYKSPTEKFLIYKQIGATSRYSDLTALVPLTPDLSDPTAIPSLTVSSGAKFISAGPLFGLRFVEKAGTGNRHIFSQTFSLSASPAYYFGNSSLDQIANIGNSSSGDIGAIINIMASIEYGFVLNKNIVLTAFADVDLGLFFGLSPRSPVNVEGINRFFAEIGNVADIIDKTFTVVPDITLLPSDTVPNDISIILDSVNKITGISSGILNKADALVAKIQTTIDSVAGEVQTGIDSTQAIIHNLVDSITNSDTGLLATIDDISTELLATVNLLTEAILTNEPSNIAKGLNDILKTISGLDERIAVIFDQLIKDASSSITGIESIFTEIIDDLQININEILEDVNGIISDIPLITAVIDDVLSENIPSLIEDVGSLISTITGVLDIPILNNNFNLFGGILPRFHFGIGITIRL